MFSLSGWCCFLLFPCRVIFSCLFLFLLCFSKLKTFNPPGERGRRRPPPTRGGGEACSIQEGQPAPHQRRRKGNQHHPRKGRETQQSGGPPSSTWAVVRVSPLGWCCLLPPLGGGGGGVLLSPPSFCVVLFFHSFVGVVLATPRGCFCLLLPSLVWCCFPLFLWYYLFLFVFSNKKCWTANEKEYGRMQHHPQGNEAGAPDPPQESPHHDSQSSAAMRRRQTIWFEPCVGGGELFWRHVGRLSHAQRERRWPDKSREWSPRLASSNRRKRQGNYPQINKLTGVSPARVPANISCVTTVVVLLRLPLHLCVLFHFGGRGRGGYRLFDIGFWVGVDFDFNVRFLGVVDFGRWGGRSG